uniref:DNA polymerase III polC-type n=1 Tax=Zeugodacus cucurbitae TaxID=28588 RepID=A0A0A1WV47_ZEUCU
MWKILLVCIVAVLVMNSEGGTQIRSQSRPQSRLKSSIPLARNRKRYASGYAGSSAGSYAGAGGSAGGYGGGYDDYDYGYAPDFGFIDPYLFHQQLTAQILANHAAQQQRIQQQIAHQQSYYQNANRPSYYGGSNRYGSPSRYAPNHAIAAASIGPGGSYHTANISPANPDVPNITNRFGGPSAPGGYKGVSVSSFSSSSDINGQKTSHRGAQTTINDNGKVTTYRVHS